jgi:hypothetical protein
LLPKIFCSAGILPAFEFHNMQAGSLRYHLFRFVLVMNFHFVARSQTPSLGTQFSAKLSFCVKQSFTDKCVPKQSLGTSSDRKKAANEGISLI